MSNCDCGIAFCPKCGGVSAASHTPEWVVTAAAEPMLIALRKVAEVIEGTYGHDDDGQRDEAMDPDLSGADVVELLCHLEGEISAAIAKAEGRADD